MTPAINHHTVAINFVGCPFGFAMWPGFSLKFTHWPDWYRLSYCIHFPSHVMIRSRKSSVFCLASNETHISKHFYCCLSLSSCGHKSNFFTFPSFFNSLEAEDVLVSRYAECSNGLKRVILHSKSNAICWQLTFELFIHFQMMCLLLKISQTNSKWPVCLHFLP